ncbi:hypothetical protein [Cupriavidus pauculus]|uniref:Uncharacterized protein n=1 Tax=Cupriavidus pauculus TaxID=82633 RepID=A0A2N5C407_9BURK|nr:hypothetical protein [Cupriavidus pauculus]PLP96956.1 hypothetical protein CYJ10_29375 [Cupriavidus pauculus]
MSRQAKTAKTSLLGVTVLMRSAVWLNGQRAVPAIVTDIEEPDFAPEEAIAVVTVTAFPPAAPSRFIREVPVFAKEPAPEVMPAAWIRR